MKSYRIVRVANLSQHKGNLAHFNRLNPGFRELDYAEQQQRLFAARYLYSDAFSRAMRERGHEAREIVMDCDAMQRRWALEHGVPFHEERWKTELVLHQLDALRPDVLYLQDVFTIPAAIRGDLKNRFPFLKLVVLYRGSFGHFDKLGGLDHVFAATPDILEKVRAAGCSGSLLYHAFDDTVLESLGAGSRAQAEEEYAFTFAGVTGYGSGDTHVGRFWSLVELMERTPLRAWVYEGTGANGRLRPRWRERALEKLGYHGVRYLQQALARAPMAPGFALQKDVARARALWLERRRIEYDEAPHTNQRVPEVPLHRLYPRRCAPALFGLEMYRLLRRSKLTFHMHGDWVRGCVGAMRLFEATGVGTCLVTDTANNMSDIFEPDRELVTYASIDECVEKVNYLLGHEEQRRAIAWAGQSRTLNNHTIADRCAQIDEVLQRLL